MNTILEQDDTKKSIFNKLYSYLTNHQNEISSYTNLLNTNKIFKPTTFQEIPKESNEQKIEKDKTEKIELLKSMIDGTYYKNNYYKHEYPKLTAEDFNKDILNQDNSPYFNTRKEFINAILPDLMEVATRYNINPYVMLAQAILETGNGKSIKGNNLFGIKGEGQEFLTTEEINGETIKIKDYFDAYNNFKESMEAYAKYITTKYDGNVRIRGTNFEDVANEINFIKNQQKYATGSDYENKIIQISKEIKKYIDDYNK